MRKRLIGYALAGAALLVVSLWSAYRTNARTPLVANLTFTLKDSDGHDVRFSDFKGKPLIVNFWATWCLPCQIETPELIELADKYRAQGLTIVGISIDDTPEQVREYAKAYKVTYPLLICSGRREVESAVGL